MLYKLGRLMQFAGLIILPVAMAGQIRESLTLWQMLGLSAVGIIVFVLGWLLQQAARPR